MSEVANISETPHLEGDNMAAWSFFQRAANAIVNESTFAKEVMQLRGDLRSIRESASVLEDIKRTQQDRIATLEAQLQSMIEAEAQRTIERDEARSEADRRQNDVYLLDQTVERLRSELDATKSERDDYGLKHMEACDALAETQGKLDKITETMRGIGFNVEAVTAKAEPKAEEVPPVPLSEALPDVSPHQSANPSERVPPQPPTEGGTLSRADDHDRWPEPEIVF